MLVQMHNLDCLETTSRSGDVQAKVFFFKGGYDLETLRSWRRIKESMLKTLYNLFKGLLKILKFEVKKKNVTKCVLSYISV